MPPFSPNLGSLRLLSHLLIAFSLKNTGIFTKSWDWILNYTRHLTYTAYPSYEFYIMADTRIPVWLDCDPGHDVSNPSPSPF